MVSRLLSQFTMTLKKSFPLVLVLVFSHTAFSREKALYRLPSGPEGPGPFGAYYTHLKYDPVWDQPWRVGDHPDVVVRFNDGGHKFV